MQGNKSGGEGESANSGVKTRKTVKKEDEELSERKRKLGTTICTK